MPSPSAHLLTSLCRGSGSSLLSPDLCPEQIAILEKFWSIVNSGKFVRPYTVDVKEYVMTEQVCVRARVTPDFVTRRSSLPYMGRVCIVEDFALCFYPKAMSSSLYWLVSYHVFAVRLRQEPAAR